MNKHNTLLPEHMKSLGIVNHTLNNQLYLLYLDSWNLKRYNLGLCRKPLINRSITGNREGGYRTKRYMAIHKTIKNQTFGPGVVDTPVIPEIREAEAGGPQA